MVAPSGSGMDPASAHSPDDFGIRHVELPAHDQLRCQQHAQPWPEPTCAESHRTGNRLGNPQRSRASANSMTRLSDAVPAFMSSSIFTPNGVRSRVTAHQHVTRRYPPECRKPHRCTGPECSCLPPERPAGRFSHPTRLGKPPASTLHLQAYQGIGNDRDHHADAEAVPQGTQLFECFKPFSSARKAGAAHRPQEPCAVGIQADMPEAGIQAGNDALPPS